MTTFTARSVEDVLAVVPVLIGFEPRDSIVMLTFGGREAFHARVDLPPPEDLEACADSLLAPARRHGVARVLFALYSDRDRAVRSTARVLKRRFEGADVGVLDVIQAHGGRWFAPLGGGGVPVHGVPYDVSGHPFRVRAVVDGRVVATSREEVAARLRADPSAVAFVEAVLVERCCRLPVRSSGESRAQQPAPASLGAGSWEELGPAAASIRPEGPQLRVMLDRHLIAGTVPDAAEAALILLGVLDPDARHHAWFGMRRVEAVRHVRLWTDLVRRAPEGLVAGAAGVLAFAAWMHGDGALAWCAVDRCLADCPGHTLGLIVADALERAVPPMDDWDDMFPRGLGG